MRLKGKAKGKAKGKGLWLRILSLIQGSTSVSGVRVMVRVVGFAALSAAALATSSAALSAAALAGGKMVRIG